MASSQRSGVVGTDKYRDWMWRELWAVTIMSSVQSRDASSCRSVRLAGRPGAKGRERPLNRLLEAGHWSNDASAGTSLPSGDPPASGCRNPRRSGSGCHNNHAATLTRSKSGRFKVGMPGLGLASPREFRRTRFAAEQLPRKKPMRWAPQK